MRVLVVDDNATNRRILEEMLKNWHMLPSITCSGEIALEMMEEGRISGKPYRLLLIDVNMPIMDGFELGERIRQRAEYQDTKLILLTSSGMHGDAARCRELGMAAYLNKPVKQSSLLNAISTAFGTTEPEGASHLENHHILHEHIHPLRILLAEDIAVNQKIAVSMLEKRGHTVVVAGDGQEAVAALEAHQDRPFDLVLMDVQMPRMDGLAATALIRTREKETSMHIPIVALTAHAMKGDREACLAAGMDAYVSKPLKANELFSIIEKLNEVKGEPLRGVAHCQVAKESIFDTGQALESVDGDMELFREVAGLFRESYPKTMEEIRAAIDEGDADQLNRAAHSLKGSIINFGARNAVATAFKLEVMGKNRDFTGGMETYSLLANQMEHLKQALEKFAGRTR